MNAQRDLKLLKQKLTSKQSNRVDNYSNENYSAATSSSSNKGGLVKRNDGQNAQLQQTRE